MDKQLPIYRLKISEQDNESGVYAISLVDAPAIESDWFAFSKESETKFTFKTVSADKQILAGYFMIPDKMIYRNDNGKEYFVVFDAETINTISEKFNKNLLSNQFNIQHNDKNKVSAFVKENWMVDSIEFDKCKAYGFEPVQGGWFGLVKVEDNAVWNEFIKTGQLKGFSIEGMFEMELQKMMKNLTPTEKFFQNIYRKTKNEEI